MLKLSNKEINLKKKINNYIQMPKIFKYLKT